LIEQKIIEAFKDVPNIERDCYNEKENFHYCSSFAIDSVVIPILNDNKIDIQTEEMRVITSTPVFFRAEYTFVIRDLDDESKIVEKFTGEGNNLRCM